MVVSVSARTVGFVVAAALAGTWFGVTVSEQVAREQVARVPAGTRPIGSQTATVPQADKLRQRLAEPPLPQRGRNPFVYGSRAARRPSMRDQSPDPIAAAAPPAVLAPPVPMFRLSGIASDMKDGVAVYTAIMNDQGSIVFAKAGDKLSNGYSVVRVEEMSVTLLDATGVTQTIRLP